MFKGIYFALAPYFFFLMVLDPLFLFTFKDKYWENLYKYRYPFTKPFFDQTNKEADEAAEREYCERTKRFDLMLLSIVTVGIGLIGLGFFLYGSS